MVKKKASYSNNGIKGLIALTIILLFASIPVPAETNEANFQYEGTINGKAENATASFNYMKRINIWNLSMRQFSKKPRENYNVNIFFSRNFTPATGTFPIAFSYLNKEATCGGSFIYKLKNGDKGFYSNDTNGSITFSEFSDIVKGTYSMEVHDRDGRKIKVSGSFELNSKEEFRSN